MEVNTSDNKKKAAMKKNDSTISVYMKIRFYVMNEIFHKAHKIEKLMSSRQLAEKFDVSQNTVQRALSQLIKEGYLISRKGVGNFINPAMVSASPGEEKNVFIGIIIGDGMVFSFDEHPWSLLSSAGNAMIRKKYCVRHLQFPLLNNDQLFEEIQQSYVDGLVWGLPGAQHIPLIKRLRDSGLPVVVYNTKLIEGVNSVITNFGSETYNDGKVLLAENRKNLFFAIRSKNSDLYINGFKKSFGDKIDMTFFDNPSTLSEELSQKIESGEKPDAFYIHGNYIDTILSVLKKYNIDISRECRLIGSEMLKYHPEYKGLVHVAPFEECGMIIAEMMDRMINKKKFTVEHKALDIGTEKFKI